MIKFRDMSGVVRRGFVERTDGVTLIVRLWDTYCNKDGVYIERQVVYNDMVIVEGEEDAS